jgi:hypothetical protein
VEDYQGRKVYFQRELREEQKSQLKWQNEKNDSFFKELKSKE